MLNNEKLYKQINNSEPIEFTEEEYAQYAIDYQNFLTISLPNFIRQKRNGLLAKSDWTQYPDCPLSAEKKSLWLAYRQELRDLPLQIGFPTDVIYPNEPT
jgi:hypothetical protein